jgi:hypothetical protein
MDSKIMYFGVSTVGGSTKTRGQCSFSFIIRQRIVARGVMGTGRVGLEWFIFESSWRFQGSQRHVSEKMKENEH